MSDSSSGFDGLALSPAVLKAVKDSGYETPTPIQARIIPLIMAGRDVLGQAQTGTGKTAAFALPLLTRIDVKRAVPQVLVLTPTRELCIQVAEAFQHYASHIKGFHVLPVYGGQSIGSQLGHLRRGAHVVVGTPGRLMDHIRRKTLKLDGLTCLVLDEADEMLRMGFIDDVEWILQQTPEGRQITLFSATLPPAIRTIARKHLQKPEEVTIKVRTTTAETINQHFWVVSGFHKLDALTRILEAETFEAMLIFVRTKTATIELAEKLEARGFAASALNGDIPQNQRERIIQHLKGGKLDILVATDVAARGLDVDRISHVINYDIPYDTESYVHRIGRTGRAGRSGEAILFVAPRERRMLNAIEKATNQKIARMELPSTEFINDKRVARFKQQITDTLAAEELTWYQQLMEQYQTEHNVSGLEIAAALAKIVQGDKPLLMAETPKMKKFDDDFSRDDKSERKSPRKKTSELEPGMERFRIEVGKAHGVKPANIVGAITNEAGLDSKHIGKIAIYDEYSLIDLPEGMPREVLRLLKRVWVSGQLLRISRLHDADKAYYKSKPVRFKSKSDSNKRSRTKL